MSLLNVKKHIYPFYHTYIWLLVQKGHCFPSLGNTKNYGIYNILLIACVTQEFYICENSVFFPKKVKKKNHGQRFETER